MKRIRTICCFCWAYTLNMIAQYGVDPYEFELNDLFGVDVYFKETEEYVDLYIDITDFDMPDSRVQDIFALGIAKYFELLYGWKIDYNYASLPCGTKSVEDIARSSWFRQ